MQGFGIFSGIPPHNGNFSKSNTPQQACVWLDAYARINIFYEHFRMK
jgi:hypothetical protein